MSPPPPPSPLGNRSPPALWSTELPFALLPQKKRWLWLWRTTSSEATDPVPDGPPPPVLPQIHAIPAAHEADAVVSSPSAGQKRSSPLPTLAGDLHEPVAPPLPPRAADGMPSTPPPCKRGRKVVRRVRKVIKKIVPKRKTASAAAQKETIAAEAAASAAGASQLQLQAVAVPDEEYEPGEFIPDKTSTYYNNADAARQPLLLGEQEAAGEEVAVDVAGEPEAAEQKLVSSKQGAKERAETARQNRMREVFVGALHRDAKEEDVRVVLAEAGEITEVRMVVDAEAPTKNRGYCFVRYREPAQARKAIEELGGVKICGKPCRIQALDGNAKEKFSQRDPFEDYTQTHYEDTRHLPMGGNSYSMSHNPHARNGSNAHAMEFSSYGAVPHAIPGYSPIYHHGSIMYLPDSSYYGLAEPWDGIPPMRQSGSRRPGQPHGRRH